MKICLVGLDNLPVLALEYRRHTIAANRFSKPCSVGRWRAGATM